MSKSDDRDLTEPRRSHDPGSMLSIEVSGRDARLWKKREARFLQRLWNSVKKLLGSDIPSNATANPELQDAADTLAQSAYEALKSPQLVNMERQASIKLKLAEANEKEANARRLNFEADKLEMEIERERVLESQAIVDRMIQRGELIPVEKDGKLYLVLRGQEL